MIKLLLNEKKDRALEASHLFGGAFFPNEWLEEDVFSAEELFLAVIRLEDVTKLDSEKLLPQEGYLYFFIDKQKNKFIATVRYCSLEPDAYTEFNDEWDIDGVDEPIFIDFEKVKPEPFASGLMCGEENGKLILFKLCFEDAPDCSLFEDFYELLFLIKPEDLKNKDFSDIQLKIVK